MPTTTISHRLSPRSNIHHFLPVKLMNKGERDAVRDLSARLHLHCRMLIIHSGGRLGACTCKRRRLTTMENANRFTRTPSLLKLPLELRTKNFRHLHLNARPIGTPSGALDCGDDLGWDMPGKWGTCRLSAAALRTCRQWYSEGSAILYGENVFAFKIWSKYEDERAPFLKWDHIADCYAWGKWGDLIRQIKRYEIIVEIQSEDEFSIVRSSVRKACEVLCNSLELQELKISFQFDDVESCTRVLEPFSLLRNVRSVTFTSGVPPVYARYLKSVMEGSAPLDHLPRMYRALQEFAGPFEHCDADLQIACEAMEESAVEDFKRIRKQIVDRVEAHMDDVRGRLYDHDGEMEGQASNGGSINEQPDQESTEL